MHTMKIKWGPSSTGLANVPQLQKQAWDLNLGESTGDEWQAKPVVNVPVLCHLWMAS